MNIRFLSLFAVVALYWKSTSAFLARQYGNNNGESERIYYGDYASTGQFPYAAAIYYNNVFICTASIISRNHLLTAAHCVLQNSVLRPEDLYHVIADVDRVSDVQPILIRRVTIHPEYNSGTIANDIAIMETWDPIEFNENVSAVPLAASEPPSRCAYEDYKGVVAMGWGRVNELLDFPNLLSFQPDILQYADQKVICMRMCLLTNSDRQLCAVGDISDGIPYWSTVCRGDSGGPLVETENDTTTRQIGITSYMTPIGCGQPIPAVFTKVSMYRDFIEDATNNQTTFV